MKIFQSLVIMALLALVSQGVFAEEKAANKATQAEKSKSVAAATADESMNKMDKQITAMRQMHEKMAKAKTPEERKALIAEHTKLMHEGMAMMGDMRMPSHSAKSTGKSEMKDMSHMHDDMKTMPHHMNCDMNGDVETCRKTMEKRMDMMEGMLQMMMDRLDNSPN